MGKKRENQAARSQGAVDSAGMMEDAEAHVSPLMSELSSLKLTNGTKKGKKKSKSQEAAAAEPSADEPAASV